MGLKAFCVHGHFYQPPREDPLTGEIPPEPGAAPFHDWNERIFSECYQPNLEAGNFQRISFNVGPTLFQWMDRNHPEAAQKIAEQDRKNVERYGAGNAMAQAYNHSILPLASPRDRETQVAWGIADFEHRFGRKPRGMWLPETAVNSDTLVALADAGIEFTILAPWQAARHRHAPGGPYAVHLGDGKKIAVFFYNQDLSTRISFDPGATVNADDFVANRLAPLYHDALADADEPQLNMIASDGELYGHHQHFRDKFLAYLMDGALLHRDLVPTFPELWLRHFPPRHSISIREDTSWSCHHGVVRWMGDCSCTPRNAWKAPLRTAFNRLADEIDRVYEEAAGRWVPDPWALRNAYIHVILGEERADELINGMAGHRLDADDLWRVGLLLEAERERQRMFTSCGWFFDDFDRIEPKNNVAYAARAVWLVRQATRINLAPVALNLLRPVRSPRTGLSGAKVFTAQLRRNEAVMEGC
jgi:alpha-amylase/alpha-mannosidase (GH57 family)